MFSKSLGGALFFFALTLASAAHEAEVTSCARIKNDTARLECYDLLFKKSTQRLPPIKGHWDITTERSKVDDTTNVVVSVKSIEPVRNRYGRNEHLDLIITCRDQRTMLYIIFGGHFMSSLNSGTVTYRIDKKPAQKKHFRESNDHKALGLWTASEAIPFVRSLYDANILFVRATPHSESAVSAEFNIAGLEAAIAPLSEACKWGPQKRSKSTD